MPGRCSCRCLLVGGPGLTVSGDGVPYVVETSGEASFPCGPVVDCACAGLGGGLTCVGDVIDLLLSPDAGNGLSIGTDGALFAELDGPPPTTAIQDCMALALASPLLWDAVNRKITVKISADAGNTASILTSGSFPGLFVGAPAESGWVNVTTGFLNGATAGTPTPAYRKTRDGQIRWRGRVNVTTTNTTFLTIPAGAATNADTNLGEIGATWATANFGNGYARVTLQSATLFHWENQQGTSTALSLDAIRYY